MWLKDNLDEQKIIPNREKKLIILPIRYVGGQRLFNDHGGVERFLIPSKSDTSEIGLVPISGWGGEVICRRYCVYVSCVCVMCL